MGLKDRRANRGKEETSKPEKKDKQKAPIKVAVVKKTEQSGKLEKKKEEPQPENTLVPVQTKTKKPWDGLGIIGGQGVKEIADFKAEVKRKGLILGEVLYNFMKDYK